MVEKMDRDEGISANDSMNQGMDMETDEGPTTDMEMDRPSMGMEDTTPSMGMEDTTPSMGMEDTTPSMGMADTTPSMGMEDTTPSMEDGRNNGMGMESTMDQATEIGSNRKWGWLRRLTRRS